MSMVNEKDMKKIPECDWLKFIRWVDKIDLGANKSDKVPFRKMELALYVYSPFQLTVFYYFIVVWKNRNASRESVLSITMDSVASHVPFIYLAQNKCSLVDRMFNSGHGNVCVYRVYTVQST